MSYLYNIGHKKALNMNDDGEVSLRTLEDNIWEQWTFDIDGTGHISNVAINYMVLDAADGGIVKGRAGEDNPYMNWQFKVVDVKEKIYNIIHVHDGQYLDANTDDRIVVAKHNQGNPYQQWQLKTL